MKVWHKIFFSILLVATASAGIFGSMLIQSTHKKNLQREQDRSCREIDLYISALNGAESMLGDSKAALDWYNLQYQDKGLTFAIYNTSDQILSSEDRIDYPASPGTYSGTTLTNPGSNQKCQLVVKSGDHYFLLTSCQMAQDNLPVLLYSRDITSIYQQRSENLLQMLIIMAVVMAASAIFAYYLARYITKPLVSLQNDVRKMADGKYIPVQITGSDEINQLRRDFSNMADTINQRETELSEELQRRKDFVAAMTHEMNTPLTSLLGYAQFLQHANCSEKQRYQSLDNIESESRRMIRMYEKLRQIHLMEGESPARETVYFSRILKETEVQLAALLQEKNIFLEKELFIDAIESDGTLLLILLNNFIKNAITYSQFNGRIRITIIQETDGRCRLTIRDWGAGIPREQIAKVTEPFYRVDKSRSRATGGTGLGLYLCKQIIERLEGELNIESDYGKGTSITVLLPAAAHHSSDAPQVSKEVKR